MSESAVLHLRVVLDSIDYRPQSIVRAGNDVGRVGQPVVLPVVVHHRYLRIGLVRRRDEVRQDRRLLNRRSGSGIALSAGFRSARFRPVLDVGSHSLRQRGDGSNTGPWGWSHFHNERAPRVIPVIPVDLERIDAGGREGHADRVRDRAPFSVRRRYEEQRKSIDNGDRLPQITVYLTPGRGCSPSDPEHDLVFVLNLDRIRAALGNPQRTRDAGIEVLIAVRLKRRIEQRDATDG